MATVLPSSRLFARERAPAASVADARRVHLEGWDRLRVLAAIDTVGLHVNGSHPLFGFGLPLFLILAVALGVSKRAPRPTRRFLGRRVDRILLPWFFWSLALLPLCALRETIYGRPAFAWLEPEMLLYGPSIHLWFLPFILVAGLAAHGLHRVFERSIVAVGVAFVLGVALLAVA
ncbi:MAG: acyltransferase family protein, partial [Myxococcota bacterium]